MFDGNEGLTAGGFVEEPWVLCGDDEEPSILVIDFEPFCFGTSEGLLSFIPFVWLDVAFEEDWFVVEMGLDV